MDKLQEILAAFSDTGDDDLGYAQQQQGKMSGCRETQEEVTESSYDAEVSPSETDGSGGGQESSPEDEA